jgi:hypothetical protein
MTAAWLHADFVDDVLFLVEDVSPMAVVDPATGEPRWLADRQLLVGNEPKYGDLEVSNTTGLGPVARVGGEPVVFLSAAQGAKVALRLEDASQLWQVPAVGRTMDADDQTVLLSDDAPTARALSAVDGTTKWETPGVWGQYLAGHRVLGAVSSDRPGRGAADSYVVGLDAATGQRVWSLEGRYQRSELGFVAGDLALVYARPASGAPKPDGEVHRDAAVLIDVATGAEVANMGWDFGGKNSCAADGDRLIACTLDKDPTRGAWRSARLVTFDVAGRTGHDSPKLTLRGVVTVEKVWHDYVFVDRSNTEMWAVDRDGNAVSDKLPGTLIGISDDYAAVTLPERGIVAVYTHR